LRLVGIQDVRRPEKRTIGKERLREVAARWRPILIADHRENPIDIEVDGIAEDDKLQDRRHDQRGEHAPIAQRLTQLFLHHIEE
jgi:hypothetical protein